MAAGDEPANTDQSTILDHLLEAWPEGEEKEWSEILAERLAEYKPALYEGWTVKTLNAAVRPHGITIGQRNKRINGKQFTKPAIARADLVAELNGTTDHPDSED